MKFLNLSLIIICSAIYSSFFKWGLTVLDADGIQLFGVLYLACPLLILSGITGYFLHREYLFIYSLLPISAGLSIASPVLDHTITYTSAAIGFTFSIIFITVLLYKIITLRERDKNS